MIETEDRGYLLNKQPAYVLMPPDSTPGEIEAAITLTGMTNDCAVRTIAMGWLLIAEGRGRVVAPVNA